MNPDEFLQRLKREVIGHPALTHPFLERFGEGDADAEGIRTFAIQYYRHVRVSRLYLAALISRCRDDEKLQLALAEVLFDEYGHLDPEETHPALYRRFLVALGIGEEEWEEPPTLPEIELYITTHYALSGHPDFRLGLGALGPASEWPVPPIYARLSDGLRKAAGLPDEALEIFTSHVTMDVTHARIMMDAIAPYAGDEEGQRESMRAPCARSTPAPLCSVVSTGPSTGNPSPCSMPPPSGSRGAEIASRGPDTTRWYGEDLAYIHDVGHAEFALGAAPGILEILDRNGIHDGLIVDLGCGSGLWARELVDAGYRVLGIDISEAMIELSRKRVPEAGFR